MRPVAIAVVVLAAALPGCIQQTGYICAADAECVRGGETGRCELTGACSFEDSSCAGGRRYGESSRGELAGQCVDGGQDGGEPDARPDRLIDTPLRVTTSDAESREPSIVWTGSEYGIAWYEDVDGGEYEIYFTRVAGDGELLMERPLRVTNAAGSSELPWLVWTGSEYGVAWYDRRHVVSTEYEVYFRRISASGELVGDELPVSPLDNVFSGLPSLIWTGEVYGLAWVDHLIDPVQPEIYLCRIDTDGEKIGADVRVTESAAFKNQPFLAWADDEFAVAWYDNRDGNYEVYFAKLDQMGQKFGVEQRVTSELGMSYRPRIAWTGSSAATVWNDTRDGTGVVVYFAEVSATGVKLAPEVPVSGAGSADPVIDWTGSAYGIAYVDSASSALELRPRPGEAAREIAAGAGMPLSPGIVWNGEVHAVAWSDLRDGNYEIYLRELTP